MNSEITLDATGSLTLTPEILAHLRARPGQKVKITLMEDSRILVETATAATAAPGAQLLRDMLGRNSGT